MNKPGLLRAFLEAHVHQLREHPDKLHVFVEEGTVATRRARASVPECSFELRYTVQLIIVDWAGSADQIIVPILAWAETHQPDLFDDLSKRDEAIKMRAEIINHDAVDIELKVKLSEAVVVRPCADGWICDHRPEPLLDELSGPTSWSMFINGEAA